jgi:CubicO group peptidase (beta-lactamase class C family)
MIRFFYFLFFIFSISFTQNFDQSFSKICLNHDIVGGTLLTYKSGVMTINHYGMSNIRANQLVDNKTIYKVASISKLITAIGVMKLYEDGLININNNINDYLGFDIINPHYTDSPITVKMLLNHTSSLVDSESYFEFLNAIHQNEDKPKISFLFSNDSDGKLFLDQSPGTFFTYSNINYGLLGVIIEQVTKKRFDQYLDEIIFKPLNIKGGFNLNKIDYKNLSALYRNGISQIDDFLERPNINLESYILGEHTLLFSPHSGCRVSALDLLKLINCFLNKGEYFYGRDRVRVLNSKTIDLMLNSSWKYDGLNGDNFFNLFNEWGLGLQITQNEKCTDKIFDNQSMYGHIGQAYGLLGNLFFDIEQNSGFVFIVNGYYNQNYLIGQESSFSQIEEDVFKLIKSYFHNEDYESFNFLGKKVFALKLRHMYFFKKNKNVLKKIFFDPLPLSKRENSF